MHVVRHDDVIGLLALDLEVEVGEDLTQQVLHAQYEQRDHLFGILWLALILLLVVAFSQQFDQEVANFILESLIIEDLFEEQQSEGFNLVGQFGFEFLGG